MKPRVSQTLIMRGFATRWLLLVALSGAGVVLSSSGCAAERAGRLINEAGSKHLAGDQEGALRLYEEAARIDPTQPAAPYGKGLALRAMGRTGEAMDAFRESIRVDPRYRYAYTELASTQVDRKLQREAIETLVQGHRAIPSDGEIQVQLEHLKGLPFAETAK